MPGGTEAGEGIVANGIEAIARAIATLENIAGCRGSERLTRIGAVAESDVHDWIAETSLAKLGMQPGAYVDKYEYGDKADERSQGSGVFGSALLK